MSKKLGFKIEPAGVPIRRELRYYYQLLDENGAVVSEELAWRGEPIEIEVGPGGRATFKAISTLIDLNPPKKKRRK